MSNFINLVDDYINIQAQKNNQVAQVIDDFVSTLESAVAANDASGVSDYALFQLMSTKQRNLVSSIASTRVRLFDSKSDSIDFGSKPGAFDNELLSASVEIASIERDFEQPLTMYDSLFTSLTGLHDTDLVNAAHRLKALTTERYVESDPLLSAIKDEYKTRKDARLQMESLSLA